MKLLILLHLIFSVNLFAKTSLKTGDVLLQPLKCWTCSLIEAEEDSIFSHSGIVFVDEKEKIWVMEAYVPHVRMVSFEEFNSKTEPGQELKILRLKEKVNIRSQAILNIFNTEFFGLPFDRAFRFDDSKLYCSEFVLKILNRFLANPIPTKKMHFNQNRKHWETYFQGQVPDGEEGISPSDFMRNGYFDEVLF